ncbi:MAG TPA: sugar ABC transporter permease [Candidatus Brocadiia bacterium]|nr:sugar ABC transporter permease [Candidatus Brocadiia bacterium]
MWAIAFLAPNFLGFIAFTAFPVVFSLVMSFTNWSLKPRIEREFVGLRNYSDLLGVHRSELPAAGQAGDPGLWLALWAVSLLMLFTGIAGTLLSRGPRARGLKSGGALWLVTGVALMIAGALGAGPGMALLGVVLGVFGWVLISLESATWMGRGFAWPAVVWLGILGLALTSTPTWRAYDPNDRFFWFYFYNTAYFMLGIPVGIAGSLFLAVVLSKELNLGTRRLKAVLSALFAVVGAITSLLAWNSGQRDVALLVAVAFLISILGVVWANVAFRTILYIPNFTAGVALIILWSRLYNPHFGMVNTVLDKGADALEWSTWTIPDAVFYIITVLVWAGGVALVARWAWQLFARVRQDGAAAVISHVLKMAVAAFGIFWVGRAFIALAGADEIGREFPTWLAGTESLLGFLGLPEYFNNKGFGLGAREAIMIMGVWTGIGGNNMLLYLAGISNIPVELYEAAEIDGAGRWARFRHVTWPQLAPTTFFIVIMATIGGLQGGFEEARVMTLGGPAGTTTTLSYYIYTAAFEQLQMGYASAVAWVMFAIIFALTLLNWRFGNRYVNY